MKSKVKKVPLGGTRKTLWWWTTAPQIVPGVLAEVCVIRAAGRSRFSFFRFFELFRWIDGKIDARFVIYVKN